MRKQMFRAAVLSSLAGLVIAFLFAVPLMEQAYTEEMAARLETVLCLAAGYDGDAAAIAAQAAAQLGQEEGLRLTVLRPDGTVLADTQQDPAAMGSHAARPELEAARQNGTGRDVRHSETLGERRLYVARLVERDGEDWLLRADVPLSGMGTVRRTLWFCALIGIALGLLVALLAARYTGARAAQPLQALTLAARSMAMGETPVRVDESAGDEIGELARAFNRMGERLTDAYEKLARRTDRLDGVLQGIQDGVIAIGRDGCLVVVTDHAREMLGETVGRGRRLADCGASYRLLEPLLEQVLAGKGPQTALITIEQPAALVLQVYAAPLGGFRAAGGALAVVSDVTRLHQLEGMRRDFAANVTHEFKTPLTSIRGYVELLKMDKWDAETTRSFCDIIEIEAERLQKLTDDLLQLAAIESRTEAPAGAAAPLDEAIERVLDTLRPEAEKHRVALSCDSTPGLVLAAEPERLYAVLKNLLENAIRYNRPGGSAVLTAAPDAQRPGWAILTVRDTGVGIEPEHLDRIFERFYRVDKGRSRELGGTGLGLSIVKHTVSLYGGEIAAASTPGEGTTFTLHLPLSGEETT